MGKADSSWVLAAGASQPVSGKFLVGGAGVVAGSDDRSGSGARIREHQDAQVCAASLKGGDYCYLFPALLGPSPLRTGDRAEMKWVMRTLGTGIC